eukprot:TRINITY_DN19421_c0_g4_i1.p1 TRINITY_DN19421_c0_g4~~TRINITY_DN19421_c0_g4_i1.p1  ORF type:complete len:358 (-),score=29.50 TRINITY_DN19421_c0_g4_i1:195-1268(-)
MPSKQVDSGNDSAAGTGPVFLGVPMKYVSLVLLVAQTVSVVFTVRLSRTAPSADGVKYLNTTAVFFSEVLKFCCSFVFLCNEQGSIAAASSQAKQHLFGSPMESLKLSVPSLLYTLQTNLLFVSLSNLNGAVYQVTYQLKILTTAVLSVVFLGKTLGPTKWFALCLLTFGVALIQMPRNEIGEPADGNAAIGLAAVLSACVTSGVAGVYLEKVLQQSDVSIWVRNLQLALFGSVLAFVGTFLADGNLIADKGFLQGYNALVWFVIVLQALNGLVVAAVLKYADNILKCFGTAISMVLSCLLSAIVLGEFVPDLQFLLGTALVLQATSIYSLGLPNVVSRLLARVESGSKAHASSINV